MHKQLAIKTLEYNIDAKPDECITI